MEVYDHYISNQNPFLTASHNSQLEDCSQLAQPHEDLHQITDGSLLTCSNVLCSAPQASQDSDDLRPLSSAPDRRLQ